MPRPRKPTAIKELQGTLQPCRTNKNEPPIKGNLTDLAPPSYLTKRAKEIWIEALSFAPDNVLGLIDKAIFEQWVITYEQLISIAEILKKDGLISYDKQGNTIPNPLINTQIKLMQTLRLACTELGFTPASKSKVSIASTEEETINPFLQLAS